MRPAAVEAFATEVVETAQLEALAYVELVPGTERARWEVESGLRMKDTDGQGNLVPTARRDLHAVVRYAVPVNDTTRGVLGLDLMSDPTRAEGVAGAMTDQGATLVGPINLVISAQPGLFMTAAVRDIDGVPVGFIASGVSLTATDDELDTLAGVRDVTLTMDGEPLIDGEQGEGSATFELAARTFTVHASDSSRTNWAVAGGFASAAVLLAIASLRAMRSDRDQRARALRSVERAQSLAALAEDLVAALSVDSTLRCAADQAGSIVGAQHTNVVLRDDAHPNLLRVVHDDRMPAHLAERFAIQRVEDPLPLPVISNSSLSVRVSPPCDGRQLPPIENWTMPTGAVPGHRGLGIVAALAHHLDVDTGPDHTTIVAVLAV